MAKSSYITTESGGRQNIFPTEPRPYIDQSISYDGYPQNAEKVNGRWSMIGLVALLGAYITTGQIIPGFLLNAFTLCTILRFSIFAHTNNWCYGNCCSTGCIFSRLQKLF